MRKLTLATMAGAAIMIAVPVTGQAASATLQLTQSDNATEFSSRHRGWYHRRHYGFHKPFVKFRFGHYGHRPYYRHYGYHRPYYRHYGRYHDDY
jgi:hypothetical protein